MVYSRRPGQSMVDLANAKAFEDEVRNVLPDYVHIRTDSTVDLDFYVPPIIVEVKEKRQKLSKRWWGEYTPDGTPEENLFVIDELTVRKALKHWPYVWFVLRDLPQDRIFLASIAEILSADRHRFNRNGKGKWVVDISWFTQVVLDEVLELIKVEIDSESWKASCCVISAPEV